MSDPSFTPAQLRALAWLPSDGGWRCRLFRDENDISGFDDLVWREDALAEVGLHPASEKLRYRLTPSGVRLKAELIANGKLEQ